MQIPFAVENILPRLSLSQLLKTTSYHNSKNSPQLAIQSQISALDAKNELK
jgi:hypothetical protein